MKIHKVKKSSDPVKLYAHVPSRSTRGLRHMVAYIRQPGMKRWTCTCTNQNIVQIPKRRHCYHIKKVKQGV